ncbi:hypothetical protein FKR81_21075 [Lentzea tibetensis]|uniref:Uncharacterized protein n=1 Tax=Lentzea tibetensis TaxID=2591470 RepID=A0A563ER81_9PSEU|nr:hypothetical protein [Lentzea tibetensis]TWP50207.1 hypothetical protein FKR81_21075 [Lentzea tibetensis]
MKSALALGLAATALATGLSLATTPSALAWNNLPCQSGGPTQSDQAVASSLSGKLNGRLKGGVNAYQMSCARAIVDVVKARGLDEHTAAIAITTTIVETNIKNLDGGDRDSRGLFQQRPSMNWGTPEQVVDPVHATNEFINHLVKVSNWHSKPIGEVCQDVQHSGTPTAYYGQAHDGEVIADALWGAGAPSKAALYSSDFNGNGSTDYAVWRESDLMYNILFDSGGEYVRDWGSPGEIPVAGDFNGNGNSDYVTFTQETGMWHILFDDGGVYDRQWGNPGDIPVAGDFNGNGKSDYVTYRPSDGTWHILFDDGGFYERQWGSPGEIPVGGDFNGNGHSDYVTYSPEDGVWHILFDSGGVYERQWGSPGEVPVSGDFNGNGNADYVTYRPEDGMWRILFDDGSGVYERPYGGPNYRPI